MKDFDATRRKLVECFVQLGRVRVKVNDDVEHYFQTQKGCDKEILLSPILFNIVVDVLAVLTGRAKENGQIGGLIPR